MRPSWVRPLLTGRGWTPALRAIYHRQVGHLLSAGIEVELDSSQFRKKLGSWMNGGETRLLDILHANGGSNWKVAPTSGVAEYTCLFDLTDPVKLRKSVRQHYLAMLNAGFSFGGGLHVNYVVERNSPFHRKCDGYNDHYDFERLPQHGDKSFIRLECKGGRPTMIWEDLLLQIVLGITTRGQIFKKGFSLHNSEIVKALPKSLRAYTIFGCKCRYFSQLVGLFNRLRSIRRLSLTSLVRRKPVLRETAKQVSSGRQS